MFVRDRMTPSPVTITSKTPFQDALKLMQEHGFRRLPVVDDAGKLLGIVAERDLLYASPSPATSLSVWELNYLLSKLKIERLMTKDVITTTPDALIEDAACLMVQHKIGALPVVDENDHVVGIITETDVFKSFVNVYRGDRSGLRLTLRVPDRKGILAELSQAIFDMDGDIVSISSFYDEKAGHYGLVIKVKEVSKDQLIDKIEELGDQVLDAREVEYPTCP